MDGDDTSSEDSLSALQEKRWKLGKNNRISAFIFEKKSVVKIYFSITWEEK